MADAAADVDWSLLPKDTLELISKLLTFDPDYIRFRSVCTSWRSSAPKQPQFPWLIGHRSDDKGRRTIFSFFKFSSRSSSAATADQILPIPELPESPLFDGMTCRGSSHGWLSLLAVGTPSIVLWNPVTRSKIQLPTLPQFNYSTSCKYFKIGEREYRCTYATNPGTLIIMNLNLNAVENYLASQVILSSDPALSSDFVALAVCYDHQRLVFCRVGDEVWTSVECPTFKNGPAQAAFYKGKFYVAKHGHVYLCDLGVNPGVELIASVTLVLFVEIEIGRSYLVESDGDLLLVLAFCPSTEEEEEEEEIKEYQFKVFKLVWGEQVMLQELKSLGEKILFLDYGHSFSLGASSFPGCRSNSIYYIQEYYMDVISEPEEQLRVCNFEDGSTTSISSDRAIPHQDWRPRLWFKPSFLP